MVDYIDFVISNPRLIAVFITLVFGLSYLREARGEGFSIPFGIITASLLIFLYSLIPAPISEWAPYSDRIAPVDAVSMILIAVIFSAVMWIVVWPLTQSGNPKPQTIADLVFKRFGKIIDSYARILGLFALFLVAFVYAFISNFAEVLGEIGNVLAIEPFVTSNIITGLAGFAALGGELPFIGSLPVLRNLSPMGWLVLVSLLVSAGAMAAYNSRGKTRRLFR